MITTSVHVVPIEHEGYQIKVYEHIDRDNWVYVIYEIKNDKWKRKRAMQHYINEDAALQAAKNFINNHLINKL